MSRAYVRRWKHTMPPRLPPPKGVVLRAERWAHNNTPGNHYIEAVTYSYVMDGVVHYKNRPPQDRTALKKLQASLTPQVLRNYTCFTWQEARRKLGFSAREMAILCRLHGVSGFRTDWKDKKQAAKAAKALAIDEAKARRKAYDKEYYAANAVRIRTRQKDYQEAKARQKADAEVRRSQGPRCPEPCPSTCPRASSPRCARRAALKAEIAR